MKGEKSERTKQARDHHSSVLQEMDATHIFDGENVDWRWCCDNAPFTHRDACEFVLFIGGPEDRQYSDGVIESMTKYGCTGKLIIEYAAAREQGARWLLLYA